MIALHDLLRPDVTVLFDGGMGTGLMDRGLEPGMAPEQWCLDHPGVVMDLHRAYVDAGAEVIGTNTFGATASRLEASGVVRSVREVAGAACSLAREAAGGRALVAGSVGPLGELIEPHGPVSRSAAGAMYAELIEVLLDGGVDWILIETMISVGEAEVALRQALAAGAEAVGVTMTFAATPQGIRTAFGETPGEAARRLADAGAHIVGANCGTDLTTMRAAARELIGTSGVPVLIQPNAGVPELREGMPVYPEGPETFAEFLRTLRDDGIRLLGGCCGTTPEHIRLARRKVRS